VFFVSSLGLAYLANVKPKAGGSVMDAGSPPAAGAPKSSGAEPAKPPEPAAKGSDVPK
jgi:hypothetical protein